MKPNCSSCLLAIVIASLLGSVACSYAQTNPPSFLWAKRAGGKGEASDSGQGVAVDITGNVYVAGSFSSTNISFGSVTLTNSTPASSDVFVAKYDSTGSLLWAKSAGGSSSDIANGVAADDEGNAYVTGFFQSATASFGNITLTNTGSFDVFVAKYDTSGNVLWAKRAGGNSRDVGYGVAGDGTGNAYVTGYFDSAITSFDSITLTNSSFRNIFVAKYDSSGNVLWAKRAGGSSYDYGQSIAADAAGNICVTGGIQSTNASFDNVTLTNVNPAFDDIFVAKYDSSGNVLWAKRAGGNSADYGYGVAMDAAGNVYGSGYFLSTTASFGSITLTNVNPTFMDIFVANMTIPGTCFGQKMPAGAVTILGRV